jgi:hypothetical protein
MVTVLFIFSALLVALAKGVEDITADEPNWNRSVFSRWSITGFWGPKDFTWRRKYSSNRLWNLFSTTLFVALSDVWHLANLLRRVGYYLAIATIIFLDQPWLWLGAHLVINTLVFHLAYHYILRKRSHWR